MNKQISERFRRRCEHEFRRALNGLSVETDVNTARNQHVEALQPDNWGLRPAELFEEEYSVACEALASGGETFMRVFPGKVFLKKAAEVLGLTANAYVELVCSALDAAPDSQMSALATDLETCLAGILPPRKSHHTVEAAVPENAEKSRNELRTGNGK